MKVITLTTDMGLHDHYVASMKGRVLNDSPDCHVIDITHSVRPFDIAEAAFHIRSCYHEFPKGTVHVIGVDAEPIVNFGGSDGSFPAIMEYNGHYFVATDNGFFGAFLGVDVPEKMWRIGDILQKDKVFKFTTKNILLEAACKVLNGNAPDSFAESTTEYKRALTPIAVSEPNLIKGHVIHIDNYGNVITNIDRELFERKGKDVPFVIYLKRREYYIDTISEAYNEVPQGEKVAIFNENNLLEVAINRGARGSSGGAAQLLGMNLNDIVRIEFTPQGSHQNFESLF